MINLKDPSQRGTLNTVLGGVLWVLTPIETFCNFFLKKFDSFMEKAEKDPEAFPKALLIGAITVIIVGGLSFY